MPRRLTAEQLFNELLARHEPKLAQAFMSAVKDVKGTFSLQRLNAALSTGDIEAALEALNLSEAVYEDLLEAIRDAYLDAGKEMANALPKRQMASFRFGGRNPRAEAWLSQHSAALVGGLMDDQRAAIRQELVAGMTEGAAPRSLAPRIVGRVSRATGKREGGIIGLSTQQAAFTRSARQELASADPEALRNYLTRTRRDRRFDRSITKAIREGRALSPEIASKASTAYERRLLALRAQTIARTEAMSALHEAQFESLEQAVEARIVTADQIRRVWRSASDGRVRHTHRGLNGDSVGLRELFISPSGAALRFPGDPRAPVAERVNCRCWAETRIDFNANLR
jgi:hypothetical protein